MECDRTSSRCVSGMRGEVLLLVASAVAARHIMDICEEDSPCAAATCVWRLLNCGAVCILNGIVFRARELVFEHGWRITSGVLLCTV
jgi:hypothetical protein